MDRQAERDALRSAIRRCHSPKSSSYANYGGRGLAVCDEWRDKERGFERFYAHVGPRPSPKHSLDRIDNSRGYEPGNVRWADKKTQTANRRPWTPHSESWEFFDGFKVRKSDIRKRIAEREELRRQLEAEGMEPGT